MTSPEPRGTQAREREGGGRGTEGWVVRIQREGEGKKQDVRLREKGKEKEPKGER